MMIREFYVLEYLYHLQLPIIKDPFFVNSDANNFMPIRVHAVRDIISSIDDTLIHMRIVNELFIALTVI